MSNSTVRTNAGFLDSVPIGAIIDWPSDIIPENWIKLEGQAISRTIYDRLFSLIGTTFGIGDGATTFNLPDYRGRTGVGKSSDGTFAQLGSKVGSESTKIANNNLPSHIKNVEVTKVNKADLTFNGTVVTNVKVTKGGISNPTGLNVIQPSLVINKIMKVK